MGRPSRYTPGKAAAICARIADGESLRAICAAGHPDKATVFRWLEANLEFRDQYARAREAQADTYADEIVEIADDGTRDYRMVDGHELVDHDHIARSRLRVDARKWVAAKLRPKKYGEKVDLTGAILTASVDLTATDPVEAARIYQRIIKGE
jgi:hypothetical protein